MNAMKPSLSRRAATAIALSATIMGAAPKAAAQAQRDVDWTTQKCVRYKEAYGAAIAKRGKTGLSDEFLARHDAFLATNCTAQADVCPRSGKELELANILVLMSLNGGLSSTFLPFACRKPT